MIPSRRLIALVPAALAASAIALPALAEETPDPRTVLMSLGFPESAIPKLRAGELVETSIKSSNERELAVGLAFLVKDVSPKQMMDKVRGGLLDSVDEDLISMGVIEGDGSLADFAKLELGDKASAYRKAKAGSDLNLSKEEIAALQAVKDGSDAEVTAAVHKMLLARHQAYRKAGLEGIAPYDRGSDPRSAGADLRTASEASATLKQLAPDFYNLLIQYPADKPGGMLERYDWSRYQAHGAPTEILTHRAAHTEGEAYIVLQRQFYASGGYNSVQALAGFFPVKEGTLVVYTNRTSTDQVAGFGGGAKRSIGSKVMASELTALYGRVQQAAEK